jgi:dTDP-4-amino-4,6-dideoxygalactose transaminase
MKVPFNRLDDPLYSDANFYSGIRDIFENRSFLFGKNNSRLILEMQNYLRVGDFLPLSSGTSALSIAIKSLNLPKGKKVLMAANAGGYGRIAADIAGVGVKYADCDKSGLFTLDQIRGALSEDIGAVLITHLYGQMIDVLEIKEVCDLKGIYVIEDCAQSFGAKTNNRLCGTIGHVGVFSFYPTKNIGAAGDAGGLCTDDKIIFQRAEKLSQYGWSDKYKIDIPGGENSRMDEIQAFVLLCKLATVDNSNEARRLIWNRYKKSLLNSSLRILGTNDYSFVAHLAVIDAGKSKGALIAFLTDNGIASMVHYPIIDTLQDAFLDNNDELPNAYYLSKNCISIPLFPSMNEEEIDYVCEKLAIFVQSVSPNE